MTHSDAELVMLRILAQTQKDNQGDDITSCTAIDCAKCPAYHHSNPFGKKCDWPWAYEQALADNAAAREVAEQQAHDMRDVS